MYADPPLAGPPTIEVFPDKALALWLKALARPEADLKRQAADAVSLARRRGVAREKLTPAIAPLEATLDMPDQHPTVHLAVAGALIALDARDSAKRLFRLAASSRGDLRNLVEPALARWDYRPARAAWLARLGKPAARRELVLAIRGLAAVGEQAAFGPLRDLVLSAKTDGPVRLEAARALAALRDKGMEKDAKALMADASPRGLVARLAAAALLRRHDGDEAVALLQSLLRDPEPAVAGLALTRLIEIDARHALGALDHLLASADPGLRGGAVTVLRRQPTKRHVHLLADRLDDVHPDVRVLARRALGELAARQDLRSTVISEGERMLSGRSWRALEQSAVLLAQLDHKPAAGRLLELLPAERPEVFVTAAWGLRKLAVASTLAPVTRHVAEELARHLGGKGRPGREGVPGHFLDHQVAQLNQLLGRQKHAAAGGVLRRFIGAKARGIDQSRAAAIWALGLIHEGNAAAGPVAELRERLDDTLSIPPEDGRVRQMAAVTLGRMKAKETLRSLRKHYPSRRKSSDPVSNACGWAIERITGETMLPAETIRIVQRGWFLVPEE
jgi:HEAT repeat protein